MSVENIGAVRAARAGVLRMASTAEYKIAPMRLLDTVILTGRNIYHRSTVIRASVDFGGLSGKFTRAASGDFRERFLARFIEPASKLPNGRLNEHLVSALRSPQGVAFEDVLLEAFLCLESIVAFTRFDFVPMDAAQLLHTESRSIVHLVWASHHPATSRAIAHLGLQGVIELLPDHLQAASAAQTEEPVDFDKAFAALKDAAYRAQPAPTTALIALAAAQRDIPFERLAGPHLYLGQGAAQRVLYSSVPSEATHAATQLSRDKRKTIRRLAQLRLPVPQHERVDSVERALAAAARLGYPVVLKPLRGKMGGGVTVGIAAPADVPAAFERARASGVRGTKSDVIVETFVAGTTYRLLVIGAKFVAALKIVVPTVLGDGKKTIGALIEELNSDPLRDQLRLYKVVVDDELKTYIARSGCDLDSIPEKGKQIALRSVANVGVGGLHTDVTEAVHTANQEMAVRAAQAIGLSVAGIDFITPDISQSYEENGGKIVEVNARPAFCMHTFPYAGKARDPSPTLLELIFPDGATGRIPTALVFGERRTAAVARELDAIVAACGKLGALVTHKIAAVGGKALALAKGQPRHVIPSLLRDPRIETVVATLSPRRVVARGITFDLVDAVAILNPSSDTDAATYREATRVVIDAARTAVVADARNKWVLEAMREFEAKRFIPVSQDVSDPVISRHLAAGGTVVAVAYEREQDCIVIHRGNARIATIPAAATAREGVRPRARETMTQAYAVALALGMGIAPEQLAQISPWTADTLAESL